VEVGTAERRAPARSRSERRKGGPPPGSRNTDPRMSRFFQRRGLRRQLQSGDFSSQSTDEFYRRIKADELLAEKDRNQRIRAAAEQMPGNPAAPSSRVVIEPAIKHPAQASEQVANLIDDGTQCAISILHSSTTQRPTCDQDAWRFSGIDAARPAACSSHDVDGDYARICAQRGQKQVARQPTSPAF
jgi:hypothetical protein